MRRVIETSRGGERTESVETKFCNGKQSDSGVEKISHARATWTGVEGRREMIAEIQKVAVVLQTC